MEDPGSRGEAQANGRRERLDSFVRIGAPLLAASLVGAGIAVGIVAATDLGGETAVTVAAEPGEMALPAEEAETEPVSASGDSLTVQEIYRRASPGVVQITAMTEPGSEGQLDPLAPFGPGNEIALGSGFVIDKAGHIVTAYHVVQSAREVQVNFSGRDRVRASVIGTDPSTDIAVLEVDVNARALAPLPLGDADTVQVGDPVVAIGNPFGLDRTVTAGIVSALQREITAPNGFTIAEVIQTDAQINSGNSGGPLLNAVGEVIGVNSQIFTPSAGGGNVGIGFAVPINTVREVVSELIEHGEVEHAYLGVEVQTITPELAENFRLPVDEGALVATVREESPAEAAGLRGGDTTVVLNGETWVLGGDVIVEAEGRQITSAGELRDVVLAKEPGDPLTLEVRRDSRTLTVTAELGSQPSSPTG